MQAISAVKQPQDSHSKTRFFSLRLALAGAEMPSFAKADMAGPGTCGKIFPSPHDTSNSWETSRAFTEDASSFTVGIWPPRAYPCSFCRREFRSAQALGGHMNVHRRDRARLRHPSPPPSPLCAPLHNQQQMASSSLFQSQKYIGVSPSAGPSLSDQELPAIYTASSTLNDSSYIPINFGTSIPLCLHQLASEAASSLMQSPLQPCTGSADLHLSLWRPMYMMNSTKLASHKCNTRTPPLKETPTVFSSLAYSAMVSSAKKPLAATATPSCRRNATACIAAEDESPRKKSHTGSSLHISQKSRSTSQTEDTQFSLVQIDIEDTCRTCSDESREASSGDVDLELRLGQKPAPNFA